MNDEYKYLRVGHVNRGLFCDDVVEVAFHRHPDAEILPARWKFGNQSEFIDKFGLGIRWAITQSYHLFIISGSYVARFWTNTQATYSWVDVTDVLAHALSSELEIQDIPTGSLHKCRPMTKRAKITDPFQVNLVFDCIKNIYGL